MGQSTLIADTRFLADLHSTGGADALNMLSARYDAIIVPQDVIDKLDVFDSHDDIQEWLTSLGEQVEILPDVPQDVLLDAFPGNYNNNAIINDGLDATAYPILHAIGENGLSGPNVTVATNNTDILNGMREMSSGDVILGVHGFLDREVAGGALSEDDYETLHAAASQATYYQPYHAHETPLMSTADIQQYRERGMGPEDIPTQQHPDTYGFSAGTDHQYFVNPTLQTLTSITPEGTTTEFFDSSREASHTFGQIRMNAYENASELYEGSLPATVAGDFRALSDFYLSRVDPTAAQRIGQRIGDAGDIFAKGARVLGPIGGLVATYEAGELGGMASQLVEEGLLPQEAMDDYGLLLGAHVGQQYLDWTMTLELKIQSEFDEIMDAHDVHPVIRDMLEPSSVLEDLGHVAAWTVGVDVPTEAEAAAAANAPGTPLHEAIEIIADYESDIESNYTADMPYPETYQRLQSPEIQDTFERLLYEETPTLPVEITDEMSQEEQVSAVLDAGQEVYRENGYTRFGPPREAIEPEIAVEDSPLPQRADVAEDYDYGAF